MKEKRNILQTVILILILAAVAGFTAVAVIQQNQIEKQRERINQLEEGQKGKNSEQPLTGAAQTAYESTVIVNVYRSIDACHSNDTFLGREGKTEKSYIISAQGSGVTVGKEMVLTCWHIIESGDRITVNVPDGDEFEISVIAEDQLNDLALLKVPGLEAVPAVMGDSREISLGQIVLCSGTPASEKLQNTLTVGIISGTHRRMESLNVKNETVEVFQTDAAINGGCSGGGIFNLRGELLGIVSRKYVGVMNSDTQLEGIGMCIPAESVQKLLNQS